MKYQKGFVPLVIILLIVLGMGAAGGGYVIYKDKQQQKKFEANIQLLQNQKASDNNTLNNTTVSPKTSQPVVPALQTQTQTEAESTFVKSLAVSAAVGSLCQDNDWNCLIVAARFCTPITLKTSSIGILNQYEISSSKASSCNSKISYLGGTVKFGPAVINYAISQGAKQSDVDSLTKFLQMGVDHNKGKILSCQSSNTELVTFLLSAQASEKQLAENGNASLDSNSPFSQFLTTKCTHLN